MFTREKLVVIDIVAKGWFSELVFQLRGVMVSEGSCDPIEQLGSLRIGWLFLLLRRHLTEVELFLNPVENVEAFLKGHGPEGIQLNVTLLDVFVVARIAITIEMFVERIGDGEVRTRIAAKRNQAREDRNAQNHKASGVVVLTL